MSLNNQKSGIEILKELAQNKKEDIREAGKTNKKRVNVNGKLILMIAVYLSSIFVTALKELVTADLDWNYILTSEFLANMLFNTSNNLFILLAVFVYFLDKYIKKSEIVAEYRKMIYTNVKAFISSIFTLFLKNFNRERRKNKYKHILETRLAKLDKEARDEDLICWLKGTANEKANNKYCLKRQDLVEQMDDTYIEEHIDEIYVAIKETTQNFVKYGYTKKAGGYHDPWDTESGTFKFIKDLGPKILLSIALLLVVNAIRLEGGVYVPWEQAVVAVIFRLYPMAVNTYIGITYAKQYLDEKIIVDLGLRLDISEQALEYQKNFQDGKIKIQERSTVEHALVLYKGAEVNG